MNVRVIRNTIFYMLWLLIFGVSPLSARDYTHSADIVIFSYHRPLQLYALLESMQKYIADIGRGQTHVIYRADNDCYRIAYEIVHADFPEINFIAQGNDPQADFKPLTLQATFESPCPYVVFAVDDIIVTDTINLTECIQALESTGAYGFYLRLGTNLTDCYTLNCPQPLPRLQKVTNSVLGWQFSQGKADWGYPNTVDMTLYRKSDIEGFFRNASYSGPNLLEGYWAGQGTPNSDVIGLCYLTSKMVNIPCNRVQDVWNNRHMGAQTVEDLLDLFLMGHKIAIDDLARLRNPSVHMEYDFRFIER